MNQAAVAHWRLRRHASPTTHQLVILQQWHVGWRHMHVGAHVSPPGQVGAAKVRRVAGVRLS